MALLRVASDAQLVEEAPLEGIDWLKLPPLQKRGAERRTEAFTGVGVVLGRLLHARIEVIVLDLGVPRIDGVEGAFNALLHHM